MVCCGKIGLGPITAGSFAVARPRAPAFCGLRLDRDLNASRNILGIGRGPPDLKPVERLTSTWPLEAGQVGSVNQEASLLVRR